MFPVLKLINFIKQLNVMRDWKAPFYDSKGPGFMDLAKQALSSTQKGYDLLAEKFDYTPYRTSSLILDIINRELEEMEMVEASLDVCCGTGAMTQILLDHSTSRVVGLDISKGMMDVARKKLSSHPGSHILEFVQGEALHLPFNEEFDIVTNFGGLGHIVNKDVPLFLEKVNKSLKKDGRFIFVTTDHPSVASMAFWRSYSFNFLIHIRNVLIKPPFIMYYLTFQLPKIKTQLEEKGFEVEIREGLFPKPFHTFKLVLATKK